MDTIECIYKYYATWSIWELEDFLGCKVNRDSTNITLKIYQPRLITNMTKGYN